MPRSVLWTAACAALAASIVAAPTLRAEEGADRVAAAAQRSGKPFVKTKKSCGDPASNHLCATIRAAQDDQSAVSGFEVRFGAPGTAIVTWQASVTCSVVAVSINNPDATGGIAEYYLNLSLQDDNAPLQLHRPGTVSVGERRQQDFIASGARGYRAFSDVRTPVTLVRAFTIEKKGLVRFRTVAKGDFRTVRPPDSITRDAFCDVNGGSMIVDFRPD